MSGLRGMSVGLVGAAALLLVVPSPGAWAADANPPVVVTLDTAAGEIDVAVYADRAPLSAADFLRYVDRGLYDGAVFYRTVRADNDHGTPKIEVIQGGLLDEAKALPPIAHETTRDSGIAHVDGTVSLARGAPGTGSGVAFFVCVGDQPALDFGGTRNPDGQGFAAFGRVVRGMDVVRKIHAMPATAPSPSEYMAGQLLSEPVVIRKAYRGPIAGTPASGAVPSVAAASEHQAELPEVEPNHIFVTLRKESIDAISKSTFLSDRFSVVQVREVKAAGQSWTGVYLFGWRAYLELFAPGGVQGFTEGSSGVVLSVPKVGSGKAIKGRLDSIRGEEAVSDLASVQADEKVSVPWFEGIGLKALDSSSFKAFLMDFRPEFAAYRRIEPDATGSLDRHDFFAARITDPAQRRAYETSAFDDLSEVQLELGEREAAAFGKFAAALGYTVAANADGQRFQRGTFTILVTTVPDPTYRVRMVSCSLRRDAGPATEHTFGPDARLRLEGGLATWSFGPR